MERAHRDAARYGAVGGECRDTGRRGTNKVRGVAQSETARQFPGRDENDGDRSRRGVAVARRDSWSDGGVRSGPPPSSPCKAAASRRLEAKESHAFSRGPPAAATSLDRGPITTAIARRRWMDGPPRLM